jgi:hypothetical protein
MACKGRDSVRNKFIINDNDTVKEIKTSKLSRLS